MKTYFYRKHELGGWTIRRRLTKEQQAQYGEKDIHLYFASTEREAKEDIKLLENAKKEGKEPLLLADNI